MDIPKIYNPKDVEPKWAAWWEEEHLFRTEPNPAKTPFTIMMPPPNVTGVLHMGHALQDTVQDTLIRYHRMRGFEAHWQAGTDHAGIATQTVVERELAERKKPGRVELGREKFLEEVWKVVERNKKVIAEQKRSLGDSPDWSRERFTFDEGLSRAVREVFVRLYEEGLIYRGPYIVNWSPALQSAISDEEVDHREIEGSLWYVRYPGVDGGPGVVVATTRPETMLGDTAVMVHPEDERYRDLVGGEVELPLTGRRIPVIADEYVDREFGTGAVKVTPAHDPNDFEIGKRHDLPMPVILDEHARVKPPAPEAYVGLDRFEAREAVLRDLEKLGLIEKVEKHVHAVGYCQRSKVPIEPYLSTQWFLRMKPLAEPALEAVRDGRIRFVPRRWEKVYFQWVENIRDWCISRQLWWGHRIPAWYCDECGGVTVAREDPPACARCGSEKIRQDEDVLDTWFSSWLWPFSTLGWPEKTPELEYYHPTDVLVSGYDIIFFWIARMIIADLRFTGEVPFRTVYITGMIRDKYGRWMSKSLGNGIDPLEMIDQYGADAVRYSLIVLNTEGQDIRLDPSRFEMGRNFANKLWNSFRLLAGPAEEVLAAQLRKAVEIEEKVGPSPDPVAAMLDWKGSAEPHPGRTALRLLERAGERALEDRWIRSRFLLTAREVGRRFEQYRLSDALLAIYRFTWNEFCDWYLEAIKPRIAPGADEVQAGATLRFALEMMEGIVRLLHPFMPFITEELYHRLGEIEGRIVEESRPDSVALAEYPTGRGEKVDRRALEEFGYLQELVGAVRNVRGELLVPPSAEATLAIREDEPRTELIRREWKTVKRLAHL
ncbi:MAG TPA: valine--tRNA ligase, partial [Bacteroidetes bacterium]|nr:valine--tRNA ligase [Bacteroidota bacterium]